MTLADANALVRSDLVMVRRMTSDDLTFAADLHAEALPHGFFGRLGPRFLTTYYRSFVDSPHAMAFVAEAEDGPAGALVGTMCSSPHYGWVLRNYGMHLALRGTVALLRRPSELAFFVRTRIGRYLTGAARIGRRRVAAALPTASAPTAVARSAARRRQPAVLTHVAVAPPARGLGVGAALERAFVEAVRAAGCRRVMLVTLAGDQGAGAFYRRLGWSLTHTRADRDGRPIECYELRL